MPKRKIIFILVLIIFLLIIGSLVYFLVFQKPAEKSPIVPEEKTIEEVLQSLTAPEGETPEISEETMENLTAPGGGEVSGDVIRSLTALQ